MVEDEGRFGRMGNIQRSWAPKGYRPLAPKQLIRKYVYAYSAVCPQLGKIFSLILPYSNTEMMTIFLNESSKEYLNYFIIMQVDGASYHTAKKLKLPDNIRFIQQPSYSPELNAVEHVWDEVKEKHFANRSFNSIDDVIDSLSKGLNELANDPEKIKTMTSFPFLDVLS